ncbi:hypothetical protein RJ641_012594 [Dillenia turbinata]|uniref:Glycerol-3-phosphate acyltransferase RAM2/GPAT1-8 HAD-like domain-containing protein n=1 Tax=Dillenia turbinata TaxID=194707 RepID=A0AAN8V3N4_9MAGN
MLTQQNMQCFLSFISPICTLSHGVLGVDKVFGTEIATYKGRATGFVCQPGTLTGKYKEKALLKAFGAIRPHVGLGHCPTDFPFMALCKEGDIVPATKPEDKAVPSDKLPKPITFQDGRLVQKPKPFISLLTILWFPISRETHLQFLTSTQAICLVFSSFDPIEAF